MRIHGIAAVVTVLITFAVLAYNEWPENSDPQAETLQTPTPTPDPSKWGYYKDCSLGNKEPIPAKDLYIARFHTGERKGTVTECNLRCIVDKDTYDLLADPESDDLNEVVGVVTFFFRQDGVVERQGFTCFRKQDDVLNYLLSRQ